MCHNAGDRISAAARSTASCSRRRAARARSSTVGNNAVRLCGQCHTGQRDGYNLATLGVQIKAVTDDTQLPTADNKVVRAHFLPAASTLLGGDAGAWYQYPFAAGVTGGVYTARNEHGGRATCTSCHDPHTGKLPADADIAAKCGICHFNEAGASVSSFLELEEARQFGFEGDIDRDGNATREPEGRDRRPRGEDLRGHPGVREERRRRRASAPSTTGTTSGRTRGTCGTAPNNVGVRQVHAAPAPRCVQLPHVPERRRRLGAQPALRHRDPLRHDRGPERGSRREVRSRRSRTASAPSRVTSARPRPRTSPPAAAAGLPRLGSGSRAEQLLAVPRGQDRHRAVPRRPEHAADDAGR